MSDISVILTVWKRNNLATQLEYITNQTADISDIYVYQNESHVDITSLKDKYNFKHIHSKDVNFKFHGRFVLPLLFDTTYTAIFDDDTMPNKGWLDHCKKLCEEKNCIVGANCRTHDDSIELNCGDGNTDPVECDIVGHCWFFKTKWIHYMWREKPISYDNGEDIHLCATCNIFGGIKTYFPAQPNDQPEVWGDAHQQFGMDEHASYKRNDHNKQRHDLYSYWIDKGWNIKRS